MKAGRHCNYHIPRVQRGLRQIFARCRCHDKHERWATRRSGTEQCPMQHRRREDCRKVGSSILQVPQHKLDHLFKYNLWLSGLAGSRGAGESWRCWTFSLVGGLNTREDQSYSLCICLAIGVKHPRDLKDTQRTTLVTELKLCLEVLRERDEDLWINGEQHVVRLQPTFSTLYVELIVRTARRIAASSASRSRMIDCTSSSSSTGGRAWSPVPAHKSGCSSRKQARNE